MKKNNNLDQKKLYTVVILMTLLCIFALSIITGCTPSQVNELAISKTKEDVKTDLWTKNSSTKNFQVKSVKKQQLSRSDQANGIEAIWIVTVDFLTTENGTKSGKWYDQSKKVIVMKKNGQYLTE